ncbi:MAG TPA: hypothetical protein VL974_06130 [Magnetospirillum sp.]|jgi:hypothetical protein|nr:hypothetical protein [Magnetospirillum sp.]
MRLLTALTRRAAPPPRTEPPSLPVPHDLAQAPMRVQPAPSPKLIALPPPREKTPRHDLRCMSPRRFAEVAHELYVEGSLPWAEYQLVGFPSELHPEYNTTIGALTGERAAPDRPRDMLAEWEHRVDFMRRYEDPAIRLAERALDVLRHQAEPRP